MVNKFTHKLKSICAIIILLTSLQANALVYTVKSNENLSSIVYSQVGKPVYGEAGYLVQVLKINPHIKNPDMLSVGTRVNLEIPHQPKPLQIERSMASEEAPLVVSSVRGETDYSSRPSAQIGISVGVKFIRLDGKDKTPQPAKILMLSRPTPELSLFWQQNFSSSWSGKLLANVMNATFQGPTPKRLSNSNLTTTNYQYNLSRYFDNSNAHLLFSAGIEESLFLKAQGQQVISIERLPLSKVEFGVGFEIYNLKPFRITLNTTAGVTAPAENSSYKVKLGSFYFLEAGLDQQIKSSHLFGKFSFRKLSHKSDQLGSLSRSDLALNVGHEWSFE